MSVSIMNSVSGGGGISSDEVTAIASDVLKGETYVGNDTNDEIGTGTLELTGNATVGDVLKNATFYNTDAKSKQTGTLELTGNAEDRYVLEGYTFYSNNAKIKRTGRAIMKPEILDTSSIGWVTLSAGQQHSIFYGIAKKYYLCITNKPVTVSTSDSILNYKTHTLYFGTTPYYMHAFLIAAGNTAQRIPIITATTNDTNVLDLKSTYMTY